MKILFSPECLNYEFPGHPESPERIENTYNFLKGKNFKFVKPEPCSERDLLRVHTRELVEKIRSGNFFNPDTPNIKNIFHYPKLSAGSAINSMELALKDENSFSLTRPPGHHAGKNSPGGFCYFNNIAIATQKALSGVKKVAVLDIDAHHGNGSQNIFLGKKNVLYVSLHQAGIYPGSGLLSEKNCLNYPLQPRTVEKAYLEILEKAVGNIKKFNPDILGISAGFDTYKEDPLTQLNLELETYRKISEIINKIEKPKFAVLEGGYSEKLPECVYRFLEGMK